MALRLVPLILCMLISLNVQAERRDGITAPSFVSLDAIPVCYDFGCKNSSVVNLPLHEWQRGCHR